MEPNTTPFLDVRGRGFRGRAAVADVLRLLDARTAPCGSESVPAGPGAGRVLARGIRSPLNVPGFVRSAMDGYAVRASDTLGFRAGEPIELTLVGDSRPARPVEGVVGSGQAVRITTGAPLPEGTDAVLVAELAEATPHGTVLARLTLPAGRHVSKVGEDVVQGEEVLPAGRALRPQDLGVLASIGVGHVEVIRRPRVAIVLTGNELLPPGSSPGGFKIVDSNSPMLRALVERDGGECPGVRYVPDEEPLLRTAIRDAVATADVVLISGGSSVGAEDYTPRVVAELGDLSVHGIAMKPAGPTGVAFLSRPLMPPNEPKSEPGKGPPAAAITGTEIPLFLLPGNPVSCLCAYDFFAGPVIRRKAGRAWAWPYQKVLLPLANEMTSTLGRVDYVRVKVDGGGATPLASGASNLSSVVKADGFLLVAADREKLAPGELAEVWLYS